MTRSVSSARTAAGARTPIPSVRRVVNNYIYYSDFENAPAFVANQTASPAWIDGTASGSATPVGYGWAFQALASAYGYYDNITFYQGKYSLRMSHTAAGGNASATIVLNDGVASNITTYGIPALPNTSYTLSGYVKVNAVVYGGARGVYFRATEYNAAGGNLSLSHDTPYKPNTTGWTPVTVTFTTSATTAYISLSANVNGVSGGSSQLDGWLDLMSLSLTASSVRSNA